MTFLYVLFAILIFGILILGHELGHFLTARMFHVTIYEFSIGMGPKLFSRKSKKYDTVYSLRLLPIGGYVSMAGEDEESEDENAIGKKKIWQRMIVTAAGSVSNILMGVIVMLLVVSFSANLGSVVVKNFAKGATSMQTETREGLLPGDEILEIDGKKVHVFYDMNYKLSRKATKPVDVTVLRDGQKVILNDLQFPTVVNQGITLGVRDFGVEILKKTPGSVLKTTYYQCIYMVRSVFDSLGDLISGKIGFKQLSGPVGITGVITDVAQSAMENKNQTGLWSLFTLLAINLGCMNLLPLPALDGGRMVFLIIEGIRRKPIDPKIEGYIHASGMILLLLLMLIVTFKDVFTIIKK